jgi:hypothetical protein
MRVEHLVITRFNLQPWKGNDPRRHLDPTWLEGRLEIFRSVCAPCLNHQTIEDFRWFVIVDPRTPRDVREALRSASRHITLVDVASHALKGQATRELVSAACTPVEPDLILQTRIDSDDAIAPDYLEGLRASLAPGRTEFLAYRNGYQLDRRTGHVYQRTWPSGPFMSLSQPPSPYPISIYDIPHPRVARVAPLRHIETPGMWLQTLHGLNVSSELQDGIPVPASRILARFPIRPELVEPRTLPEYATHGGRWLRARIRSGAPNRVLKRVLPDRVAQPVVDGRRRQRLRAQLESLAADTEHSPSTTELESLVQAWGVDLNTPSSSFLLAVVAAARSNRPIVELGTGLTTLLLGIYGRQPRTSYEPEGARLAEMETLLRNLVDPSLHRLSSVDGRGVELGRWDGSDPIIVVNSASRHHSGAGGYDTLTGVTHLGSGALLLLDDAHEGFRRGLAGPSGSMPFVAWEVVHCPLKPWLRGVRIGSAQRSGQFVPSS